MVVLTGMIVLLTVANIVIFYKESESTGVQIDKLTAKAGLIVDAMNTALKDSRTAIQKAFDENKAALAASTKQGQRALNASIEASRNDQRAWIGVVSISGADFPETIRGVNGRVYLREGETVRFGASIQNSGKSIGRNVIVCVTFDVLPENIRFTPRACTAEQQPVSVLQPGGLPVTVWTEGRPIGMRLTHEQIEALRHGDTRCYLYGWITYEDASGRPHMYRFASLLSADLTAFGSYGGREFNDAD